LQRRGQTVYDFVASQVAGKMSPPTPFGRQRIELCSSRFKDGKFTGNEKAVEHDEEKDSEESDDDGPWLVPACLRHTDELGCRWLNWGSV
jgi:hypothetical protein